MSVEPIRLPATATIPNSDWPLLLVKGAITQEAARSAAVEQRFQDHGWQGTWTYTVYDYWHYHVEGHEVLACVSGTGKVGFGGEPEEGGRVLDLEVGDVVILPAGVGHKRFEASSDFAVAGAYPPGQTGAITRAGSMDLDEARRRIAALSRPASDPIDGAEPGVLAHWADEHPERA
ncbi:Uncharacterized protein YjlB [Fulvimarina manganoxydans]|uniref:Uncharacterized protein YjlB n=1 Tax=Fulvimarina manganoxydans TaxID=937218 RepID=A0A1W2CSA1_9HYPH|nr:hypothetical protein [Fulvimarina manganoxydans]SMC87772.1 Uncharacterized protein YjlB [Fulvimarina manganoxydans]